MILIIEMMTKGLAEIKEEVRDISARRREWDDLFSQLQGLLKGKISKLPIVRVRSEFYLLIDRLKEAVRTHGEHLEQLRYRTEKLRLEGTFGVS